MDRTSWLFAFLLTTVLAFLGAVFVVHQAHLAPMEWTLSDWSGLAAPGWGITFTLDSLGAAFLLVTTLLGMGVFVGTLDDRDEEWSVEYHAGLLTILAGVAASALSGNFLTLLLAGLLVDTGVLYGIGLSGRPRWLLVTFLQATIANALLLAATLALGSSGLGEAGLPFFLITAAAVVRMAPLPVSLFPVAYESLPRRVLALLPLATLGVGALLLGRVVQWIGEGGWPDLWRWGAVAALSVALAGWVAWRRQERSVQFVTLSAAQAAWVFWAFVWGNPTAAVGTAWGAVLALAVLAIYSEYRPYGRGQVPALLASLALLGAPGSALWSAATFVGGEAWRRDTSWLIVLGAIGIMGCAVVLRQWFVGEEQTAVAPSQRMGGTLLAVLGVPFLAALWGIQVPELPGSALIPGPFVAQIALLVFGWAGGLWMWRVRRRLQPVHPLLDSASAFFSFVWLWRLVGRAGWLCLKGARGTVLLVEGENYGWLLLFLFVAIILLLGS